MPGAGQTLECSPRGGAGRLLATRSALLGRKLDVEAHEIAIHGRVDQGRIVAGEHAFVAGELAAAWERLVGSRPAYVRVGSAAALRAARSEIPAGSGGLIVAADQARDRDLLDAAGEAAAAGHPITVEGLGSTGEFGRLLDFATNLKVDVHDVGLADIDALAEGLRAHGRHTLIAAGVDTHGRRDRALESGFDLLQGFFYEVPELGERGIPQASRLQRMRLMAALQNPDVELAHLAELVSQDVGLSHGLLKLINSAFFAVPRKIESIREAAALLGVRNIRRWATLVALGDAEGKSAELMTSSLIRARMCEEIARRSDPSKTDAYFTAGLFSLLGALMDSSNHLLLAELPLAPEITGAILYYRGPIGHALLSAIAWERGIVAGAIPPSGLSLEDLQAAYADATAWALEIAVGPRV